MDAYSVNRFYVDAFFHKFRQLNKYVFNWNKSCVRNTRLFNPKKQFSATICVKELNSIKRIQKRFSWVNKFLASETWANIEMSSFNCLQLTRYRKPVRNSIWLIEYLLHFTDHLATPWAHDSLHSDFILKNHQNCVERLLEQLLLTRSVVKISWRIFFNLQMLISIH